MEECMDIRVKNLINRCSEAGSPDAANNHIARVMNAQVNATVAK